MDESADQEGSYAPWVCIARTRTTDARFVVICDDEATTQLITEAAVRNRP
jgi:hypothetical protein